MTRKPLENLRQRQADHRLYPDSCQTAKMKELLTVSETRKQLPCFRWCVWQLRLVVSGLYLLAKSQVTRIAQPWDDVGTLIQFGINIRKPECCVFRQ